MEHYNNNRWIFKGNGGPTIIIHKFYFPLQLTTQNSHHIMIEPMSL